MKCILRSKFHVVVKGTYLILKPDHSSLIHFSTRSARLCLHVCHLPTQVQKHVANVPLSGIFNHW